VAAVGVYALGLRLAQVIPVLLVDPFTKSFGPFRFSIMKRPDAGATYSRILAMFVLAASAAALALTLFAPEIVRLVSSREFAGAGLLLPLLLVPGVLGGAGYVFQTGIYIQKGTSRILWITIAGGCLTLALNVVLIPRFGAYGAAVAMVVAALASVALTYITAQRIHPIAYDLRRPLRIAGLALLVALAVARVAPAGALGWMVKTAAILVFIPVGTRTAGLSWSQLRMPWRLEPDTEPT
jgi:O-antigen/teichoic acid export membrane protein